MQNFRPVGPLFLVEVEFLVVGWVGGWGGVNSNNHVNPNLSLRLRFFLYFKQN